MSKVTKFTAAQRKAFKPGDDVAFNVHPLATWFRIISREGDFGLELKPIQPDGTTENMASQFMDVDCVKQHRANAVPGSLAKDIMADIVFGRGYQCIGGPTTGYHVEPRNDRLPSWRVSNWIVPGTYRDDPARRDIESTF